MDILIVCLMILSVGVFGLRKYMQSVLAYQIQTLLLVIVFFILSSKYNAHELFSWAIVAFFTKVVFVPAILFYVVKKGEIKNEQEPIGGFFVSVIVAVGFSLAVSMVLYDVFAGFALIKDKLPLIASGFIFMLGIFGFIFRRSFIKQILSYCLFENGVHLSLALMAYNSHEIAEVGILTDAIFAVIIMSVLALRFKDAYGDFDTSKACGLRG